MEEKPNLARRGFLRGELLSSEGRAQQKKISQALGPLPPAIQLANIQDHCAECSAPCVSSCPAKIIKQHNSKHQQEGIPYLDFGRGGCRYCSECSNACPHSEQDNNANNYPIGKVHLKQDSCLSWNGVLCMSCLRGCDTKALKLNKRRALTVDSDLCNGCGNCLHTCPAQALTVRVRKRVEG